MCKHLLRGGNLRRKWSETISHGVFLLRELDTSEVENKA